MSPIALARKPFVGSITANHRAYGVGGLNVDGCRLETVPPPEYREKLERLKRQRAGEPSADTRYEDSGSTDFAMKPGPRGGSELGRWPANVLLDETAASALDAQAPFTGAAGAKDNRGALHGFCEGRTSVRDDDWGEPRDERGGASRFFYIAKPSREERDQGCDGLNLRPRDESRKPGNPGGDNPRNRGLQPRGNFHPTVKPVALMRWLVRLVTPPGGLVLDPFLGSGTTGMAAAYEQRRFIGIEREAEYLAIAKRRIASVAPLFAQEQPA